MSDETPELIQPFHERKNIVIVAARYNTRYTDALVHHCSTELKRLMPQSQVTVIRVPGAYEVPVAVKAVISGSSNPIHGVVALGVILRGSTEHADLVGTEVTRALMDISLNSLTPVIHEVLLLDNKDQAEERCCGDRLNRGREAAGAVTDMARLFHTELNPARL